MLVVAVGATLGIFAYMLLGGVGIAMGGSAVGLRGGSFMIGGALLAALAYSSYQFGRRTRNPNHIKRSIIQK